MDVPGTMPHFGQLTLLELAHLVQCIVSTMFYTNVDLVELLEAFVCLESVFFTAETSHSVYTMLGWYIPISTLHRFRHLYLKLMNAFYYIAFTTSIRMY